MVFVCLFFHLWAGIMSVWVLWAGHTGDTVEQGATLPGSLSGSRALTEQTAFNSVGARCFLGDISLWIAILDSSKEMFSVSSEVTCLWQVLLGRRHITFWSKQCATTTSSSVRSGWRSRELGCVRHSLLVPGVATPYFGYIWVLFT